MTPRGRLVVSGGIGSGKSTVVGVLRALGWSSIDADEVGHEVLTDPAVVEAVRARWPKAVVRGEVQRAGLGAIVFSDTRELAALEDITHPPITEKIESWISKSALPKVVEVSVLKVARPDWGPLAIVHAPLAIRMKRAVGRGMARDDAEARMAAQPPDREWLAAADVVIDNQGTLDELQKAAKQLAANLRQ